MIFRILFCLLIFINFDLQATDNIGILISSKRENAIFKHNIVEVLESFKVNPVLIDYNNIVNWTSVQNLKDNEIDQIVSDQLSRFLKQNRIFRIVIGGDNYNYNTIPFHPKPYARKFVTKALAKMENEGKIKIFGICGGMQGILYFNGIKLDSLVNMIGNEKAKKYDSARKYLNPLNERYMIDRGKFYSCTSQLNKITVLKDSHLGHLIERSEKKYKVKYDRNNDGNFIVDIPSAHGQAVSLEKSNIDKLNSMNLKIIGRSEDDIIYLTENQRNNDILVEGHPELIANIIRCKDSFDKRNVIFSRLLFWNLLTTQPKNVLPKNILTISN